MNSKFLYAATIAVSLVSTLALADEAPLTRAQVKAEAQKAALEGTLPRPDDSEAALWSARRPAVAPTVSQRGKAKALDSGT
jgi:hypothetical protein